MAGSALQNRFEQRARLLVEQQDAQARRIAAATDQPPADSTDLANKTDQLARAWNFTPSQQPEQDFWQQHDQALTQNLAQLPPDAPPEAVQAAHNAAEMQALNAIYPHRATLAGIGTRVLEDQVKMADRIAKIVSGKAEDDTSAPPVAPTGGPA